MRNAKLITVTGWQCWKVEACHICWSAEMKIRNVSCQCQSIFLFTKTDNALPGWQHVSILIFIKSLSIQTKPANCAQCLAVLWLLLLLFKVCKKTDHPTYYPPGSFFSCHLMDFHCSMRDVSLCRPRHRYLTAKEAFTNIFYTTIWNSPQKPI